VQGIAPQKADLWNWRSLAAAIACISIVGVGIGLGIPLLSVLMAKGGLSPTLIGLNTAAGGLAAMLVSPFAARIAARFGVVRTLLAAVAVTELTFLCFYLIDAFWVWYPLRAIMSAAMTFVFILSEYWINAVAPSRRRGLVLGIYATVLSIGFASGPALFSWTGSEGFLPFGAGMAIIALGFLPLFLERNNSPDFDVPDVSEALPFSRHLISVPTATAAVLVFGSVETGSFSLLPIYGTETGYSEGDAALLLTMVGLGNVLLQIPIGIASDRVGDRRHLLLACALVGLAGIVALPFLITNWYAASAILFLWGGVISGLYTVGLAHLGSRYSGHELASANAAFVLCYGIGMTLGPQLTGIGMDFARPHGFAWTLSAFFVFYIAVALWRLTGFGRRT
jgi:MFS family permease